MLLMSSREGCREGMTACLCGRLGIGDHMRDGVIEHSRALCTQALCRLPQVVVLALHIRGPQPAEHQLRPLQHLQQRETCPTSRSLV